MPASSESSRYFEGEKEIRQTQPNTTRVLVHLSGLLNFEVNFRGPEREGLSIPK